jgi:hypothetical protein
MSYIFVRTSSPSTRAGYYDMSPIKCSSGLKQAHCRGDGRRRQLNFESVSKFYVTFFLWCCSLLSAKVTVC